ncbi:hypothetical protein [Niallia sp. BSM11]|uniref:hypothetical protein n=1 Tax=Niallia sp. BSM11 TaxID=3391576 RepID=UPI003985077C
MTTRKKPEVDETITSGAEVQETKQSIVEKEIPQVQKVVAVPHKAHVDIHEIRKAETVQTLIYIGPSLPGNTLPQYSTFTDGFPIQVKAEMEKCPFIQELIVPVSNLSKVNANLGIKGTKDQVMYENTLAFYKEASK